MSQSRVEAAQGRKVARASRGSTHVAGAYIIGCSIKAQAAVSRGSIVEARYIKSKVSEVGETSDVLREALYVRHRWWLRGACRQRPTRGCVG